MPKMFQPLCVENVNCRVVLNIWVTVDMISDEAFLLVMIMSSADDLGSVAQGV